MHNKDRLELGLVRWPASGFGPELIGRLSDSDLVMQSLKRLIDEQEFFLEYADDEDNE